MAEGAWPARFRRALEQEQQPRWAFDRWWLNLFPREKLFTHQGGGYATLSFIPTLATMILGLIAGGVVRGERTPWSKVKWLVTAGVLSLFVGQALGWLGICPVVKRIWTPSWTLFSGGWCLVLLAAFYVVIDIWGRNGGLPAGRYRHELDRRLLHRALVRRVHL
jgi:predicted acyltransferase